MKYPFAGSRDSFILLALMKKPHTHAELLEVGKKGIGEPYNPVETSIGRLKNHWEITETTNKKTEDKTYTLKK